jgi:hypothetical protein
MATYLTGPAAGIRHLAHVPSPLGGVQEVAT